MRVFSSSAAIFTVMVSILGALGYLSGLEELGRINKNFIPMAPSTIACFLFLGISILVLNSTGPSKAKSSILMMVSFLVAVFGILEVAGYFSGLDLNFEDVLVPDFGVLGEVPIARMSPVTGVLFFLSGSALISFLLPISLVKSSLIRYYLVNGIGIFVLLLSLIFCLAYLYGSPFLYGQGTTVPMALTTAVGFLFLSFSILSLEKTSFLKRLTDERSTRGILLRYILPFSILMVIVGSLVTLPLPNMSGGNHAFLSASLTVFIAVITSLLATAISKRLGNVIDKLAEQKKESEIRYIELEKASRDKEESFYKTIGDNSPLAIYVSTGKEQLGNYVNKTFIKIFGYTLEDVPTIEDWWPLAYPDEEYRKQIACEWARKASFAIETKSEIIPMEAVVTCKDGSRKTISWSFVSNGDQNWAFGLDLTESKKSEEALRRSQKMESLGQLTGGVAHDFNNMLGVILGNNELLKRKVGNNPEALEFINQIDEGGRRGAEITRKLLMFSRQGPSHSQLVDISQTIQGMQSLIQKSLTPKIKVESSFIDNLWVTNIDRGDLEDSILNLSLNARDAMPEGGSLTIEASNKVLDEQYARMNPDSVAGEYVMLIISDTGTGMSPEVKEQIFQPFFSTKEKSKGTGLGLSMVYGFVQRSGGHIQIYSELGRGTTFRLYFPKAMEGVVETASSSMEAEVDPPHGNETVLVVDDEEPLLRIAASFLVSLDYKVMTASNGKQALEILKDKSHQIDLVFSDVVMPGGVDGYDLGLEVLNSYPSIKVLLTSGFTSKREDAVNGDRPLMAKLSNSILDKPYKRSELAVALRKTLDV